MSSSPIASPKEVKSIVTGTFVTVSDYSFGVELIVIYSMHGLDLDLEMGSQHQLL